MKEHKEQPDICQNTIKKTSRGRLPQPRPKTQLQLNMMNIYKRLDFCRKEKNSVQGQRGNSELSKNVTTGS